MNSKNPFLFSYVNKETGGGKEDNKARKKIQSTSFHSFKSVQIAFPSVEQQQLSITKKR